MGTREETLSASEQIAQTVVAKLQTLKLLPSRSWGKRLLGDIDTIHARNHFADKRSPAVLEEQGYWIARRRWISFVWYNPEGKKQVAVDIILEQGFHPGEVSDENSKTWVPASLCIRDMSKDSELVFEAGNYKTIETLFVLADSKPLFE